MTLIEKTRISMTIDVDNINRVKPMVHPFLIAIFGGKMDQTFTQAIGRGSVQGQHGGRKK